MPFYFEWRHNGIMYPWVQRIFYGKCRNNEPAPFPYEINRTFLHENIIGNNIGLASTDIPQNLEILVEATIPVSSSMSSNSSPDIITSNNSSSMENNFVESSVDSNAIDNNVDYDESNTNNNESNNNGISTDSEYDLQINLVRNHTEVSGSTDQSKRVRKQKSFLGDS
jgi:hypothetical protein